MTRKISLGLNAVLVAVLMFGAASPAASAKGTKYLTIAAVSLADRVQSEHNDENATVPDDCDPNITKDTIEGEENRSALNNGKGSYLGAVNLPQKAKVTAFSLFANDNDGDTDVYAHLVRNTIGDGISMPGEGYEVMADAKSDGAVNNVLRQFNDTTINSPKVDNKGSLYFVELLVCGVTEPYAIQIAYKK